MSDAHRSPPSSNATASAATDRLTTRGVRRRHELLEAALRLIVRDGPGAVTLRSVVTEADTSHGLVSYYFGSRDELINAALALTATRNIAALAQAVPSRRFEAEVLTPTIARYLRTMGADRH